LLSLAPLTQLEAANGKTLHPELAGRAFVTIDDWENSMRSGGGKMLKTKFDVRLGKTWWALRLLFAVVPMVAGLDKFFNLLTDWTRYLNPLATRFLPITPQTFMHVVGVIEIAAGMIVLSRLTKLGAYIVTVWLVAIALNLLVMGKFLDVAVRDLGLAVAAFTLSQLSAVREEGSAMQPIRAAEGLRVSVP
jgi:uncharacterized membrane protein YphA (DoxX/SURF4 family)